MGLGSLKSVTINKVRDTLAKVDTLFVLAKEGIAWSLLRNKRV
jgi:hypothetical protein